LRSRAHARAQRDSLVKKLNRMCPAWIDPSQTLDEFKRLAIDDPRVLQACMELSVKTPAQVLQEYQNRNRGVSINYNTVPSEVDGVKLFKTIVTAGSTVAEVRHHRLCLVERAAVLTGIGFCI